MGLADLFENFLDTLRVTLYLGVALSLVVHQLRHGSAGFPPLLTILWIWICDALGFVLSQYGLWNIFITFIYGPVAVLIHYYTFVPVIRKKILRTFALILTFAGCYGTIVYTLFYHEIWKTGIEFSAVPYAITAPVIISMGLLLELDRIISDEKPESPGIYGVNRAWIAYFSIGYMSWGMSQLGLAITDSDVKSLFNGFRFLALTSAYAVLVVMVIGRAWKYNLTREWNQTKY